MFTGIIQEIGGIQSISGGRLTVTAKMATGDLADIKLGDSIAVHGPCLTVIEHVRGRLTFDLSDETLQRSSFPRMRPGARVHLERAMRLGDRLDGHLVQGHVDGVGRVTALSRASAGWVLEVELPPELLPYVVAKGSIALDGVSLTIATLDGARITVAIVPHTAGETTLADAAVGQAINVETDILGRYVARLLQFQGAAAPTKPAGLSLDALARGGFLDR